MARTHGKILCSIWQDDDFLTLSEPAQRLYVVLFSQAKLNLVGLLDFMPKRLVGLSATSTPESIADATRELEERRYIIVDRNKDELLIRSFTRSDPVQMANSKLRKGVWSAWLAIESKTLREEAVHEMPEELFDHGEAPPDAMRIRMSGRMEPPIEPPTDPPIDPAIPDAPNRSTDRTANPSADRFSSTATAPSTDADTSAARAAKPVDKSEPPNPSSQIPPFDASQVEYIDDDERALGLAIAQETRKSLDQLLNQHHQDQTA